MLLVIIIIISLYCQRINVHIFCYITLNKKYPEKMNACNLIYQGFFKRKRSVYVHVMRFSKKTMIVTLGTFPERAELWYNFERSQRGCTFSRAVL